MSYLSKVVGFIASCVLLCLMGCSSDNSTTEQAEPISELLFVSDGYILRAATVSGAAATERGSASIIGIPGTYERSGALVTVTIPNHDLRDGFWVDLVFSAGTGGTASSGKYQITLIDANTFTVNDTVSGTVSDGTVYRKPVTTHVASYTQSANVITVTLTNHNLSSNDVVKLDFTSGGAVDVGAAVITAVDANTFTVTASNSATTSGNVTVSIGDNYGIFGVAMHPNGKWIYTTSTYECWTGSPFCWGGALISRFSVDWATGALTFEKAYHAEYSVSATGAAPVDLKFSSDGAYLFNQDDWLDGIVMWGVDLATGDLTLLGSAAGTYLHGVGLSADGTRIYNGDNIFTVDTTAPSITKTYPGSIGGCNSSVITGTTLYCADNNGGSWVIRTYSLSSPDAPAAIISTATGAQQARELAISASGARIVTAGWCGLKSFDYDGMAITPAAVAAGSNEYVDCDGSWLTTGARKMFRHLSINSAGNMIATAYYTNTGSNQGGVPPSGYMLIALGSDGALSLAKDYSNAYYARVAKFYKKP